MAVQGRHLQDLRQPHAEGGVDYIWNPVEGGFFEFNSTLEVDFAVNPARFLAIRRPFPQGFATPGLVTGMSQANGDPYFLVAPSSSASIYRTTGRSPRAYSEPRPAWDKDFNLIGA